VVVVNPNYRVRGSLFSHTSDEDHLVRHDDEIQTFVLLNPKQKSKRNDLLVFSVGFEIILLSAS
jgi:hypothetical protein